ncbi:MAG: MFS transporter [Clostridiales bacterium]|jgi:DHA3 family macrolide efflux protein-like MFS transporter|nr:MFS transporter [Clostridiales bacterium]
MRNKKETLWTKDFSCITVATILSAIGGEAMNLPLSLLVFEETQSTFLAALLLICGMLPDVILPILVAPVIDRGTKKKWIVGLDVLMALLYVAIGAWAGQYGFNYAIYILFVFVVGTISVFYRLSFSAWYPDLIPVGFEQKGFAVSGTIYPIITICMAPIATFLYEKVSISTLFYLVAGLTILSVLVELCIRETQKTISEKYTFAVYVTDIKEGFVYLKKEHGVRNIYTYMSITSGASEGVAVMAQAYYQTQPWLSVTMLGFLKSAEMIGRVIGGAVQYKWEIPPKKRYAFTKMVYSVYDTMDAFLLFMPYPLMLLNRFLCGTLGSMSATVRSVAIQSYLPAHMRARVQALFGVIFAIGGIFFQLVAGILGEMIPYRMVAFLLGMLTFTSMIFLIVIPKKDNAPIYAAQRITEEQ